MSDTYEINAKITADDAGFQKAISDTIAGMTEFQKHATDMSDNAKVSFSNIANQFQAISNKAKLWGDDSSVLSEKQRVLKTEINRLIDSGITPASKQIVDLKNAYDLLGKEQDQVSTKSKNLGSVFASIRDIMQGPIAAFNMMRQAVASVSNATIGQAAMLEDTIAAFTPLTGSAENAKNMVAALNKEAATTPYELEGMAGIAKQLLPILGNNVQSITATFRMLGDTAGGNINKLDSITRGYVKTLSTGKVSMESLNMISDAGVPIQKQLSDSMGITVEKLYSLSSQGKVSSDDLTKAFKKMTSEGGLYFEGMKVASVTFNAEMAGLSDATSQAGAAIGNVFLPVLKDIVHNIATAINGFTKWATENDNLKETLKILAISIGATTVAISAFAIASNISGILASLKTALLGIGTAVKVITAAIAANPVGAIAVVITSVLIPAIILLKDKLGGWNVLWLETKRIALVVIKAIVDYLSWVANQNIIVINGILKAYNSVASKLGMKQVKLIDPVDIATTVGINNELKKTEQELEDIRKKKDEDKKQDESDLDDLKSKKSQLSKEEQDALDAYTKSIQESNNLQKAGLVSLQDTINSKQAATETYLETLAKLGLANTKAFSDAKAKLKEYKDELDNLSDIPLDQSKINNYFANISKASSETQNGIGKWINIGVMELNNATGELEQTTKRIFVNFDNSFSNIKTSFDTMLKNMKGGFAKFTVSLKDEASNWSGIFSSVYTMIRDDIGSAFETIGESIVNGTADWDSWGVAALKSLASVLTALGNQLAAHAAYLAILAVEHALLLDFAGAAAAAVAAVAAGVGAAAAYVASGVISANASNMSSSSSAGTSSSSSNSSSSGTGSYSNSYLGYAAGTDYSMGGYAMVGEQGPERVYLPQGSKVVNARDTSRSSGKSVVVNYSITAPKALNTAEIARIVRKTQRELAFQGSV